ncbi:hypothetical protein BC829DRAFT_67367 [Chytridium lagenaria]|nr:hypothetical protein BC829DRAFT_67367 [Chytridium lagenaria]
MSYKDMAFRLAALMKMDTPMLLQFPGEPDRVPTYQERTVRDLCWRTCLFLDNVFSWGTPHVKRFSQTRVMIPNLQFYRFLPPNDTSRTALVDYITTLSYVLLNIWQLDEKFSHQSLLAQDPKDNDVLTALGMLHAWRNGLPPNLNIDEPNFWRGATFSADNSSPSLDACGTRATLLLGYHGAMCLLGRVMIRQAASLGRFADVCRVHASASAVIIGRVSRDIVSHRHINLHPFMGQSVLMAGLFLCELWKDMNDAEKRREIDEVFVLLDEFLQRLSVFWLIAKLYMGILQKERATLRPNDERAIEFAINSGTRMTV